MGQKRSLLKIYSLNQPLQHTELISVLGDKYAHALSFDFQLTDNIEEAHVVAWDGVITLKQRRLIQEIDSHLQKGKVLLLMGEAQTLYQNHPFIGLYESAQVATLPLTGWSVLPEELLGALDHCYKKISNV